MPLSSNFDVSNSNNFEFHIAYHIANKFVNK